MNANDFQKFTETTALYPQVNTCSISELLYLGNGLAGEAGEVSNKIAKFYRDGKLDVSGLKKELGDCCYYLARLCEVLGTTLEDEMEANANKLKDRLKRGVIGGNGDNR